MILVREDPTALRRGKKVTVARGPHTETICLDVGACIHRQGPQTSASERHRYVSEGQIFPTLEPIWRILQPA